MTTNQNTVTVKPNPALFLSGRPSDAAKESKPAEKE